LAFLANSSWMRHSAASLTTWLSVMTSGTFKMVKREGGKGLPALSRRQGSLFSARRQEPRALKLPELAIVIHVPRRRHRPAVCGN
jgi:hypothetical protein